MLKSIILLIILFSPTLLSAQLQLGDVEIESLSELFNKENETLWNSLGTFNKNDSKVWISDIPSMLIDNGGQQVIILAFKKDLNQDSVRTVLIDQLNEQFGEFVEKRGLPMMNMASLEWREKENGVEYLFSMSKDKKVGSLNIIRN